MIKKISLLLVVVLVFPLSVAGFSDISSADRNFEEIEYIEQTMIFGNEKFYPDRELTRGDFVKYLMVASGISADDFKYTDIQDFEAELRKYGISTKLDSSNSINLVGALSIAMKWYGVPVPKLFNVSNFKANTNNLSPTAFYAPVIARAMDLELINEGVGPFDNLTRRDFAVMIANLELFDAKVQTTKTDYPEVVMIDADLLTRNETFLSREQYEIFEDVWNTILTEYVDKDEITEEEMFYGALNGLVESLDDPYSVFQEPEVQKSFKQSLRNEVEGIGASVTLDENGRLIVVSPLVGSPAKEAGLLPNDIIEKIDGKGTDNATLTELVNKIKGESGTDVDLTVRRGSEKLEFTITRAEVKVPVLSYEITPKNVAIVKISNFGLGAGSSFRSFVDQVDESKLKGVIIDLRNNPGGYLNDAVAIADQFLDKGDIILQTVDATGKKDIEKATSGAPLGNTKTIVLVNGGSASSSEILAAALKYNDKARLFGEKTFGKGSVQILKNYDDNSALKLTIAKWLGPNGTKINKVGISPNVLVKISDDDRKNGRDTVLDRALKEF